MTVATAGIEQRYHQPVWGRVDGVLKRCFMASVALGVAVLVAVFVAPTPPPEPTTIEQMPERFARLILEKPAAPAIPLPEPSAVVETPKVEPRPADTPVPERTVPRQRRTSKPKPAPDRGVEGRAKAQEEVTQNLAQVTGALDETLEGLTSSLESSTSDNERRRTPTRRRGVRSGRSGRDVARVRDGANTASPNVAKSAIAGQGISIGAIADLNADDAGSGATAQPDANGAETRSPHRTNESLLAAVRRYTPGIQFCYDNELKKTPGLRGKMVVSITVLASGRVSDARVVEDTLGSPAVTQCVLAQIRGWKLPEIPRGVTSFKAPFVFTPPE